MTTPLEQIITNVEPATDGVWRAAAGSPAGDVSYPEDGHDVCQAVEETSFWFGHRNRAIAAVVGAYPPAAGAPFLDVGGGNGYVAGAVQRLGHRVVLVEPGRAGAECARDRGIGEVVQSSVVDLDVAPGSVGGVGLFDVLEHIEDDVAALRRLGTMLAPGGRLYLTVPSHDWLWSSADVDAGHYRRYTRRALVRVLRQAGLEVDLASYYFWALPAPMLLLRCLPERLGLRAGDTRSQRVAREHQGRTTKVVSRLLAGETRRLRAGRSVPFGASVIAVARVRGAVGEER